MTAAKTRLGCLHMHHSNIPYIDGIVAPDRVELLHFVDPGLMRRIGSDPDFTRDQAEAQVRRQLDWMASCGLPRHRYARLLEALSTWPRGATKSCALASIC